MIVTALARLDAVRAELAARSTVDAVNADGPIPPHELDQIAGQLDWIAGELLVEGCDTLADVTARFADRLRSTADLARVIAWSPASEAAA